MKTFAVGGLLLAACSATAGTFPYVNEADMTTRYETNSADVASFVTPVAVPAKDGGMQASEAVATVYMNDTSVMAMDPEDWDVATNAIKTSGNVQAAFTLKSEDDGQTMKWMGFTGGQWVELTGVEPNEGEYDVKIDLDYSLGANNRKIRYSIRAGSSEGAYTVLKPTNADDWIAIGSDAAKVAGIDLYGYVTNAAVVAKAAARPGEGTIAKMENVSMSFDALGLAVVATNNWGVNKVVATLKYKDTDVVVCAMTNDIGSAGATNVVFDFSQRIRQGYSYEYDVKLLGEYGGADVVYNDPAPNAPVDLFSTNSWFYFTGTGFENATTNGNITIEEGKFFTLDEDAATDGTITPSAAPANVGTVVTTIMDISGVVSELPAFEDDAPQFAIALGGTDAARVWKYFAGNTWCDCATADMPTANGTYEGRATFDYTNHVVKYEIRNVGSDAFKTLAVADLPTDKTALAAVAIRGGGSVSKLDAVCKLAEPAPVVPDEEKKEIVLDTNASVSLENMKDTYTVTTAAGKDCHLSWTDSDSKIATVNDQGQLVVETGTSQNGLSSYDSYVLGLDVKNANSVPAAVVDPGRDQLEGIPVCIPNVELTDSGRTVKIMRQVKDTPADDWKDDQAFNVGDPAMKIPLNGKLYRFNTIIK